MTRLKDRPVMPYYFCWLSALALIFLGLNFKTGSIDVQLHDTYFVIGRLQCAAVGAIVLSIFGVIYWLIARYLQALLVLSYLHVLMTALIFVFLICPLFDFLRSPQIFALLAVGFILAQITFVINLILAFLKK